MLDGSALNETSTLWEGKHQGLWHTVEQKQIRFAEEGSGQGQSHSPTARERLGREELSLGGEAKTGENAGRSTLGLIRLHLS